MWWWSVRSALRWPHVYRFSNAKQGKQLLHKTDEEINESLRQKLKSFNIHKMHGINLQKL
jgi:hypothetical protein